MEKPTNKNVTLFERAKAKRAKATGRCSLFDIQAATGLTQSQISSLLGGRIRFTDTICARLSLAGLASYETLKVNQAKYDAETVDLSKYDDVEPDFFK